MNHKRLWVVSAIIALVIVVSFMLSVPRARDGVRMPAERIETANTPSVALRDVFKKGMHTITGSLNAPNACAAATANATLVSASNTESILVALSLTEDNQVCLQLSILIPFSTTISAPAHVPITVTVNGTVASTTAL